VSGAIGFTVAVIVGSPLHGAVPGKLQTPCGCVITIAAYAAITPTTTNATWPRDRFVCSIHSGSGRCSKS
jgi:hypothetical protein